MEAAGRNAPKEVVPARKKFFLSSAINIAIPDLLARTSATGNEHALTFRYDTLGILKASRVKVGDEISVLPTTLAQRALKKVLASTPPVVLHTHVTPDAKKNNTSTEFNFLPGQEDIVFGIMNPGVLLLTASNLGVVAMTEKRLEGFPSLVHLSSELRKKYLQLREKCKTDPTQLNNALQALADLWKPYGDVYTRFGVRSTHLDLVSPSDAIDVNNATALAS